MQIMVRDSNVDQALRVLKKRMQREASSERVKLGSNWRRVGELWSTWCSSVLRLRDTRHGVRSSRMLLRATFAQKFLQLRELRSTAAWEQLCFP